MLRKTLLYLSNQQRVFTFVRRNGLARRMARRFVAGETIEEAMTAVRALNARGITASLDLLGESVHREEEACATAKSYLDLLDRIQSEKLDANAEKMINQGLKSFYSEASAETKMDLSPLLEQMQKNLQGLR